MKYLTLSAFAALSVSALTAPFWASSVYAQMKTEQTKVSMKTIMTSEVGSETSQPDVILELFTSQGCSSCPPANKFVADMTRKRDNVLALSYGVTYWDYLGWADTFGDPRFAERQRDYGKYLGSNNYTPQIVLNGSAHSPRYSEDDVISMPLPDNRPKASVNPLSGNELEIKADIAKGHRLSIIRFQPGTQNVAVKRGENSGRTLAIENVVLDVDVLEWQGEALTLRSELEDGQKYAMLFHAPKSKTIISATVWGASSTKK